MAVDVDYLVDYRTSCEVMGIFSARHSQNTEHPKSLSEFGCVSVTLSLDHRSTKSFRLTERKQESIFHLPITINQQPHQYSDRSNIFLATNRMGSIAETAQFVCVHRRRRQRERGTGISHKSRKLCAALLSTVLAATFISSCPVNGFLTSRQSSFRSGFLTEPVRVTRHAVEKPIRSNATDSWSKGGDEQKSSRFGVRKRVKKVLERAKQRTGLKNYSETEPRQVVAEAASIGGLDQVSDLVFTKDNYNDTPSESWNRTDGFVLTPILTDEERAGKATELGVDVDALLTAENSPLPFSLPPLSDEQRKQLAAGERIQEQSKMGREGSGFVVLDVNAPPFVVWECLLDFENYPQYINTVRSMRMFTNTHLASSYLAEDPVQPESTRAMRHYGTASISRASFVLSKYQLKIAAIHKYQPHPDGHYMVFTLDRANKGAVLQDAKGIWYTQRNPDGRGENVTRVWLLCSLKVSKLLPTFIVDYAANRAMPRATTWLKPTVEQKYSEMKSSEK